MTLKIGDYVHFKLGQLDYCCTIVGQNRFGTWIVEVDFETDPPPTESNGRLMTPEDCVVLVGDKRYRSFLTGRHSRVVPRDFRHSSLKKTLTRIWGPALKVVTGS